jgi:hypothetical protein
VDSLIVRDEALQALQKTWIIMSSAVLFHNFCSLFELLCWCFGTCIYGVFVMFPLCIFILICY